MPPRPPRSGSGRRIAELQIRAGARPDAGHLTISGGVAFSLNAREHWEEVLAAADSALYRAKAAGRRPDLCRAGRRPSSTQRRLAARAATVGRTRLPAELLRSRRPGWLNRGERRGLTGLIRVPGDPPRRRRRRPIRGCGRPADRAALRRRGRSAGAVSASRTTPGSPTSTIRLGTAADEVVDDVGRHPVGPDGTASAARWLVGSSTGQPGSPCQAGRSIASARGAVRLDQRGDRLRPDPGHPRRPEQDRGRVADLGQRELRAAHHLAGRPGLRRGGGAVDRLGADQRRGDGAVRIGRRRRRSAARRRTRPGPRGDGPAAGRACRRGRPRRSRTG